MLIKKSSDILSSEITSKSVYLNRRRFIAGAAMAGAAAVAGLALKEVGSPSLVTEANAKIDGLQKSPFSTMEKQTPYKDVTNYNNFYEFSTDKYEPAGLAKDFRTRPWTVTIDGLVKKKQQLDVDAIMKMAAPEERVYRHRRGMVHRGAMGRLFPKRVDQAGGAAGQSKICRIHHPLRPQADARPAHRCPQVALRRSSAHG
jgi:methionine sulfoxide reductase catalytic subunit